MWRDDIMRVKGFININRQRFIRAQRWQHNDDLDDFWYDTPEGYQVCDIYTIT